MWFWNIVTIITLYFIYDYFKNKRKYDLAKKFNGPTALPIIGNILDYVNVKEEDVIPFTENMVKKHGKFFRVWVFNQLSIFSMDPKDIEVVLSSNKHLTKNNLYNYLIPWLGTGLLISTGKKWFQRRRVITPTFHFKILEQFVEVFDKQSGVLIKRLSKEVNKGSFNVYPYITLCALDIISESAMGTEVFAQSDKQSEYVKAVAEFSTILMARFVKIWQRSNLLFNLFASNKKQHDENIKIMHKFTDSVIIARRDLLNEQLSKRESLTDDSNDDFGSKKKMCFLDVLLQASVDGQPLSNEDIREEVDTFMFEGHDTTTQAISFLLYVFSTHKEIQDKVFQEIKDVIGDNSDAPVYHRELTNLKYMDLVIKEALRLYPPVPIIGRRFKEEININGKIVPPESNFTIGIFNILRDPTIFKDPLKFDPDRFDTDKNPEPMNPYAFIPFSAGSRNCIGQKFAILEIKSTVSRLLRNFEVFPGKDAPQLVMNVVLRSKNGIQISLKPRKY